MGLVTPPSPIAGADLFHFGVDLSPVRVLVVQEALVDVVTGSLDLRAHLERFWAGRAKEAFEWTAGPIRSTLPRFSVLRVAPRSAKDPWIYVSDGARDVRTPDGQRLEFFLESPESDPIHVENLAMVAHFHADPRYGLSLGKVIAIGRPWMKQSRCDHFMVSLPYPFGPDFEWATLGERRVRLLWLLPITSSEAAFARANGCEALEERFEEAAFDVIDVDRISVV